MFFKNINFRNKFKIKLLSILRTTFFLATDLKDFHGFP